MRRLALVKAPAGAAGCITLRDLGIAVPRTFTGRGDQASCEDRANRECVRLHPSGVTVQETRGAHQKKSMLQLHVMTFTDRKLRPHKCDPDGKA